MKAYATQVATDLAKQLKLPEGPGHPPRRRAADTDRPDAAGPGRRLGQGRRNRFDFQYIFQQVNDFNTYAVRNGLFDRGRVKAQDKGLRSYFAHALPVIRKELNSAQAILANLPGGAAALA